MTEIIAAFVGVIGSILAWYLSSHDLKKQDRDNKRREIRLQYLIDAYRRLESSGNRKLEPGSIHAMNLESAIADIQLFGTAKQAKYAGDLPKKVMVQWMTFLTI